MPTTSTKSLNSDTLSNAAMDLIRFRTATLSHAVRVGRVILLALLMVCAVAMSGCGTGGYAGGGIVSLSSSAVTIDAGQAFMVNSKLSGSPVVSWSLAGPSCSASACGSLSSTTGASVTYTAPANVTAPLSVTLTAAVAGTQSSSTVSITVNPDPSASGTLPVGSVGTPYTTTLTVSGGTAPFTLSIVSGSLPAGLSFNATTGVISGTPTTAGNSGFAVQITDSSNVPYTTTAPETIVVSAGQGTGQSGPLTVLGGNPPAGTVGTAYSTTLQASGGTAPYSWSVISGALPSGLTLGASTGVISGVPTAQGEYGFTVQAQDASGNKASGGFSIAINAVQGTGAALTLTNPPGATAGTPYSGTIGVSGGTAPYTCVITGLPAGLTASGCTITGTPTTAGSSTLTVTATDSGNPAATKTGSVTLTVNPAAVTLTLGTLPAATAGTPYTGTVSVSGGTAPYSCTITGLPAGLTSSGCTVTGTPTNAGTSTLTVTATDSSSPAATKTGTVTLTVNPAAVTLTLGTLPAATAGTPYTGTVGVSGGTAPYSCTITGLPAGLTASGCTVSGTPTTAGTSTLTVTATDSGSPVATKTGTIPLTVNPAAVTLALGTLPGGTVGILYSGTVGVTGGTAPYSCTITGLPAGLTASGCAISGTPTSAGTAKLNVTATDSSSPAATKTGQVSLTISSPAVTLTLGTLPAATAGTPYSSTVGVTGGTAPYGCTITGLPAGLTASGCTVSGTPTTAGTSTLTVTATDSSSPAATKTGPVTLTVNPAAVTLTLGTLPAATAGSPYTGTVSVSGGTAPYSCTITGLPAGLTSSGCTVSGTPTSAGTSTLTVTATDSSSPVATKTGPVTLTINPAAVNLTLTPPPNATAGTTYSGTVGVSGGTAPYSCVITGLPAGLTSNNCTISGTPTSAGTTTITVKATDSGNPAATKTGTVPLTVNPATVTLTLGTLPTATAGTPYSGTVGVTGGTAPYSCTITGLPAGLTASGCTVSGTPTSAGTSTLTVTATDSSSPVATKTGPVTLTVNPPAVTLTLGTLPNGTVGILYSGTVGVTGGTAPYSCTITGLPAGLTSSGCTISGTPTSAGTVKLNVTATDSSSPVATKTGQVSLTISSPAVTLTLGTLPNGTAGTPYSGTVGVTGGTAPYTCTITGLPAGLTSSGCTVSGTPTTAGTSTLTVTATDSSSPAATKTGSVSLTIMPPSVTLTLGTLPNGTVGTPYAGTVGVTGGTAPYTCTITGLPTGLTSSGCVITGTPQASGTATLNVHATDSGSPAATTTGSVSLTIAPIQPLSLTGSLPNAILNQPYSQTLTATGGVQPYTYSIVSGSGSLPAGLTLSNEGVVSGTPTAPGASSFTVQVVDSESTPQTATLPLVLQVVYPTTPQDSELTGPYAFLFQGYDDLVLGLLSYQTASAGSFTADGTGLVSAGEMDSNHQGSAPLGNTISTSSFLGTYTIGTDNRGFLTLTTLNTDGTTGGSTTYAISVKAPVAPSTISTQASMIEFDNNNAVGTRGSGTMLAQQGNFTAGLNGSYVFGMSGDTPCLPTCTLGIIAGPAASVGQFTASGSTITGTGDSNIATTNYPSEVLTGNYQAADANGRTTLSMGIANTPAGVYPTDYAVYNVSPSQAFIVSTDKHSSFVLLAGSAQLQTQSSFDNTSMSGAFIGYENAATDPNLVTGLVLQNVLNFSTATIFRGTTQHPTGNGNCVITNYDQGGLSGLVNGVTGLLSGITLGLLQGLLGPPATTGDLTCGVSSIGRGTLQYPAPLLSTPPPPRVFYLSAPNTGYFLESGYAGIGNLEPQVAPTGGFVESTFNGTFVYGSSAAASLVSLDSSGFIKADGAAGTATATLDENLDVGNLNVLQLGPPNGTPSILGLSLGAAPVPAPFTLTDPTAGRYTFGTDVIYAINPNRFVLMDLNPTTTSPSVTLLY